MFSFLYFQIINCGDLDSYPLLQYLDLSYSHIEHIEDDALGRLEILEILMLDHNKLRKIPFSLPVSLEHLFLQNNDIMEIPQQAFQGLNNLKTLDLSHNKLLYLPDIMLPKLQTLNLQSSDIRGISQGIIHTLPKLNDLMLEDNPIKCADLLGIAEWASTCRLRGEKGEEGEEEVEVGVESEEQEENFVLKIKDLKNKFERMHNFYEQFGLNVTLGNESLLVDMPEPKCVKEFKLEKMEGEQDKEEQVDNKQETKTLLKKTRSKQLDLEENLIETKEGNMKQHDEVNEIKLNVKESSNLETLTEKQLSNTTTTETFNLQTTAATTNNIEITETSTIRKDLSEEGVTEMSTNADVIATTTTLRPPEQQQQPTTTAVYKGNPTSTKTSSNMTDKVKHEDGLTKRSKESELLLKDMQHKTITAKTFQAAKSKKWIKQKLTTTAHSKKQEMPQNGATNAAVSTTFTTPINNQIHTTTRDNQNITTEIWELGVTTTTAKTKEFTEKPQETEEDSKENASQMQKLLEQSEMQTIKTLTKEIKSLAIEMPKSRQTKFTNSTEEAKTTTATITIKPSTIAKIIANKETNITPNPKTYTTTEKPATAKTIQDEEYQPTAFKNNNAAFLPITIESKPIATTTETLEATTTLFKDKDLASNYNDNEHNKTLTTKTINKTNNNNSSNILEISTATTSTSSNFNKQHISKTTTTQKPTTTIIQDQIENQQQLHYQQTHVLEKLMSQQNQQQYSIQHPSQSLEKDVNVKCMQSNSNGKYNLITITKETIEIRKER